MNTTSFFYLPFRWVEDKKVSDRIIEIWPSIVKIESEVIDKCKEDYKALLKIDLRDVRNHIKKKEMYVGFGTLDELQSLLRKDLISHTDINKFRIEAREFLATLLEKMFRKNPLSFNIYQFLIQKYY